MDQTIEWSPEAPQDLRDGDIYLVRQKNGSVSAVIVVKWDSDHKPMFFGCDEPYGSRHSEKWSEWGSLVYRVNSD